MDRDLMYCDLRVGQIQKMVERYPYIPLSEEEILALESRKVPSKPDKKLKPYPPLVNLRPARIKYAHRRNAERYAMPDPDPEPQIQNTICTIAVVDPPLVYESIHLVGRKYFFPSYLIIMVSCLLWQRKQRSTT